MIRVLLGDRKPQNVAIEPLRGLLVGDPQIDVADTLELDHTILPDRIHTLRP